MGMQDERIAIAGVWYNGAYSLGNMVGPLMAALLNGTLRYTFGHTMLLVVVMAGLPVVPSPRHKHPDRNPVT
jgi:hypothetical protein